ncbi:MAG: hypothetical protein U0893_09775 [Chloroflexota bacterium]
MHLLVSELGLTDPTLDRALPWIDTADAHLAMLLDSTPAVEPIAYPDVRPGAVSDDRHWLRRAPRLWMLRRFFAEVN